MSHRTRKRRSMRSGPPTDELAQRASASDQEAVSNTAAPGGIIGSNKHGTGHRGADVCGTRAESFRANG